MSHMLMANLIGSASCQETGAEIWSLNGCDSCSFYYILIWNHKLCLIFWTSVGWYVSCI